MIPYPRLQRDVSGPSLSVTRLRRSGWRQQRPGPFIQSAEQPETTLHPSLSVTIVSRDYAAPSNPMWICRFSKYIKLVLQEPHNGDNIFSVSHFIVW